MKQRKRQDVEDAKGKIAELLAESSSTKGTCELLAKPPSAHMHASTQHTLSTSLKVWSYAARF